MKAPPSPLWTPAERARLLFQVREATRELLEQIVDGNPSPVAASNMALLAATLHALEPDPQLEEWALWLMEGAVDLLPTLPPRVASLPEGTLSVAWVARWLGAEALEARAAELGLRALERRLEQLDDPGALGLGGALTWALSLGTVGARPLAERLHARLDATAIPCGPGRGWIWQGGVALGLAHGAAGAVVGLAQAQRAGLGEPEVLRAAARLIAVACAPVAQTMTEARGWVDCAPNRVELDGRPGNPGATPGWCYGAPGDAFALLAAGRALEDAELEAQGRALALAAAACTRGVEAAGKFHLPKDSLGCSEPWETCCGLSGRGLALQRLFELTGEPALLEAARRCFMGVRAGLEGALMAEDRSTFRRRGVLYGWPGALLCLLTSTQQPGCPPWDRRLLLGDLALR